MFEQANSLRLKQQTGQLWKRLQSNDSNLIAMRLQPYEFRVKARAARLKDDVHEQRTHQSASLSTGDCTGSGQMQDKAYRMPSLTPRQRRERPAALAFAQRARAASAILFLPAGLIFLRRRMAPCPGGRPRLPARRPAERPLRTARSSACSESICSLMWTALRNCSAEMFSITTAILLINV